MTRRVASRGPITTALLVVFLLTGCAGAPPSTTQPPPTPTTAPGPATPPPAAAPTGPASLDAPATIAAGAPIQIAWTGPNAADDFITIVAAGAAEWTNEPYSYTTAGSPATLTAPTKAGQYELWYVSGADGVIRARQPIEVTAFVGTLDGPESVAAGTVFEVEWTGPNGPGDYVTLVAEGADRWTNETYFETSAGSPGSLIAPIEAGAYELWYVGGSSSEVLARRPVTVTGVVVTLDAPATVMRGAQFQVAWTGPDGPQDYITIVPAGAPDGAYLSYAYTSAGTPVTLTAPADAGRYEIRYLSERVGGVFASIPIEVK